MFPRYVLVLFDVFDPYAWHDLNDVEGVSSILGGASPRVMRTSLVEALKEQMTAEGIIEAPEAKRVIKPMFPGDEVFILKGPFIGYEGKVIWEDDKNVNVEVEKFMFRLTLAREDLDVIKSSHQKNLDTNREVYLFNRIRKSLRSPQSDTGFDPKLGCSIPQFIEYLETAFHKGMTWTNYGHVWKLDHRKSPALVPLNERSLAFHYTNLRPLLMKDWEAKAGFEAALVKEFEAEAA
jgi:hypothetical protein